MTENQLQFECPECGHTEVEEVNANCQVIHVIKSITPDGVEDDLGMINYSGDNYFWCVGCHWVVRDTTDTIIRDHTGLIKWLMRNKRIPNDG